MGTFIEYLGEWEPIEGSTRGEKTRQVKQYKFEYVNCLEHGAMRPADYSALDIEGGLVCLDCQLDEIYKLSHELTDKKREIIEAHGATEIITIYRDEWQRRQQESSIQLIRLWGEAVRVRNEINRKYFLRDEFKSTVGTEDLQDALALIKKWKTAHDQWETELAKARVAFGAESYDQIIEAAKKPSAGKKFRAQDTVVITEEDLASPEKFFGKLLADPPHED